MNDTPKALRYAEALTSAEARIVAALPDILDRMIAHATAGDVRAAIYLCDRALRRASDAKADSVEGREAEPMRRIVIPYRDTRPGIDAATLDPAERADILPNGDAATGPRESGAIESL